MPAHGLRSILRAARAKSAGSARTKHEHLYKGKECLVRANQNDKCISNKSHFGPFISTNPLCARLSKSPFRLLHNLCRRWKGERPEPSQPGERVRADEVE